MSIETAAVTTSAADLAAPVPGGIVLVIRTHDRAEALALGRAGAAAGLGAVEITTTVPDAAGVIAELADSAVPIGIGTVLDVDALREGVAAGATFAVSPNTDLDVIGAAQRLGVAIVPGVLTPTEIQAAHRAGASAVKIFPAGAAGGPSYLREVRGPLPHITYVISGSVTAANAPEYLDAGAHAVCVGRAVFGAAARASLDHELLVADARSFAAAVEQAR